MSLAYGTFRANLIGRILSERLTPANVAAILEEEGFAQACADEIALYRRMDSRWWMRAPSAWTADKDSQPVAAVRWEPAKEAP